MANAPDIMHAFSEAFALDTLSVHYSDSWVVSVRPAQVTLGCLVVSARREVTDLANLTLEEGADMAQALGLAAKIGKQVFGADKINALCLMMKDPLVHFHIIPRYAAPVEHFGQVWEDCDWPLPSNLAVEPTSASTLAAIRQTIKGQQQLWLD